MRILLMEDDAKVMETLVDYLELAGLEVDCAYNGKQAITRLTEARFDVLVADIMMPGMDGISVVKQVREQRLTSAPIIFLTARDELEDKTAAFDAGGDDYLVKPFALEELLLRIRALGRRGRLPEAETLQVGPLTYRIESEELSCHADLLRVTPLQKKMLILLMQRAPAVVPREDVESVLWPEEDPPRDALRSHVYALRTALSKVGEGAMLQTLHGKGYQLVCD